jgi:hypothetical protein
MMPTVNFSDALTSANLATPPVRMNVRTRRFGSHWLKRMANSMRGA